MKKTRIALLALFAPLLLTHVVSAQMPVTMDGYLYLSQVETALGANMEETIIWFYDGDTLDGPIRSNDYLAIKRRPIFLGPTFSSMDRFLVSSPNPYFEYEPEFNVPEFEFPFEIEELQEIAEERGNYIPGVDEDVILRTRVEGTPNGWHFYQWPADSILSPSTIVSEYDVAYDLDVVVYIDGDLDISGRAIKQKTTIVCDGNVRIVDNLKYADVLTGRPVVPDSSNNILGLIASGDILIANTIENGAENGLPDGPESDHTRKHCVITASLVSLNGSFSIENKNFEPGTDRYDGDYWCDPEGEHPAEQDLRGTIYLTGSIVQHRRDFVRTSNCSGTGYDKHYKYDSRFEYMSPPLFDNLVGVQEGGRSSNLPLKHKVEKAYPNPFNSSFNLDMVLAKRDQVKIRLVNVLGQEVFSQNYGWMNAGTQRFEMNLAGKPAGLYFAQISTSGGFSETQKIVFVK